VVAEGIETESQLAALIRRGARAGQGYLIARPGLPEDIRSRFTGAQATTGREA
jgi:EAL domain-containing protein (putative c-di-GMP-specific phosphodiesterase class I)